jgi:hypothetical protein
VSYAIDAECHTLLRHYDKPPLQVLTAITSIWTYAPLIARLSQHQQFLNIIAGFQRSTWFPYFSHQDFIESRAFQRLRHIAISMLHNNITNIIHILMMISFRVL